MARKASFANVHKALLASGLLLLVAPLGFAQTESGVDYETQIRPLFASYCYQCHGPNRATREANLRLDQKSFAPSESSRFPPDSRDSWLATW